MELWDCIKELLGFGPPSELTGGKTVEQPKTIIKKSSGNTGIYKLEEIKQNIYKDMGVKSFGEFFTVAALRLLIVGYILYVIIFTIYKCYTNDDSYEEIMFRNRLAEERKTEKIKRDESNKKFDEEVRYMMYKNNH